MELSIFKHHVLEFALPQILLKAYLCILFLQPLELNHVLVEQLLVAGDLAGHWTHLLHLHLLLHILSILLLLLAIHAVCIAIILWMPGRPGHSTLFTFLAADRVVRNAHVILACAIYIRVETAVGSAAFGRRDRRQF